MRKSKASPNPAPKTVSSHSQVFVPLGRRLGTAATVKRVGEIVLAAADQLMGWDCGSLDL